MEEKRKFSARWPIRHYTIKTNTLSVQCVDACSVTGVVEWDVTSTERGVHSVGSANIVLKIAPTGSDIGGLILSENGSVLSAHNNSISSLPQASASSSTQPAPDATATPEQQASSPTAAYAEGRQARIAYENWYNALPDGPYRDGATYWAGNRSLKPPPSCAPVGGTQDWQEGCTAGRMRLTPIDMRRKTEKDFRSGWNSM
jgi:hypothetical protein